MVCHPERSRGVLNVSMRFRPLSSSQSLTLCAMTLSPSAGKARKEDREVMYAKLPALYSPNAPTQKSGLRKRSVSRFFRYKESFTAYLRQQPQKSRRKQSQMLQPHVRTTHCRSHGCGRWQQQLFCGRSWQPQSGFGWQPQSGCGRQLQEQGLCALLPQ